MKSEESKKEIRTSAELVRELLPIRPADGHKGTFGRVCIFGGSVGLTGAPLFASQAAVRTGSGLVFLGVPKEIYEITAVRSMEVMPSPLPGREGKLTGEALAPMLERISGCDAGLAGPGQGRSPELTELVCELLRQTDRPLVVDADGLYAIKDRKELLQERAQKGLTTILTPHEGEFSYLSGESGESVKKLGRLESARSFAKAFGCVLVLKGQGTVTAAPDGRLFVNTTGNNGMAKGGSGDVLAGMILSLLGQHMEAAEAAAAAVWLHGRAGDLARDEFGTYGLTPSDLIGKIPEAILPLERQEI